MSNKYTNINITTLNSNQALEIGPSRSVPARSVTYEGLKMAALATISTNVYPSIKENSNFSIKEIGGLEAYLTIPPKKIKTQQEAINNMSYNGHVEVKVNTIIQTANEEEVDNNVIEQFSAPIEKQIESPIVPSIDPVMSLNPDEDAKKIIGISEVLTPTLQEFQPSPVVEPNNKEVVMQTYNAFVETPATFSENVIPDPEEIKRAVELAQRAKIEKEIKEKYIADSLEKENKIRQKEAELQKTQELVLNLKEELIYNSKKLDAYYRAFNDLRSSDSTDEIKRAA